MAPCRRPVGARTDGTTRRRSGCTPDGPGSPLSRCRWYNLGRLLTIGKEPGVSNFNILVVYPHPADSATEASGTVALHAGRTTAHRMPSATPPEAYRLHP